EAMTTSLMPLTM
ncbi:tRNA threonylcarbamoyladenosine dehydratase, partial [Haemophilus influenzae]